MTPSAVRVVAQAKINIRLCVLARESHGFHQLETIFSRIELADTVLVRVRDSGRSVDVRGPDTGPAEENLAFVAAAAYAEATGWPAGYAIEIDKLIPVGAGLGGGSADAGAVLRGLNALAPTPLPSAALLRLATGIGSDVPFLTSEVPFALAWGRGERMLALPAPPPRDLLLVIPTFSMPTAEAFRWLDEDHEERLPEPIVFELDRLREWAALDELAANDFDGVLARRHQQIAHAIELLRTCGARVSQLTGSGAAIVGLFDQPVEIDAVVAEVDGEAIATRTAARVVEVERMD